MEQEKSLQEWIGAVCAIDDSTGIPQGIYVIEECAELAKELTKDQRGKGNREKIVEEACDVLTTVAILLHKYGVSQEEIEKQIRFKCRRAVGRWQEEGEM